jgi:hypothetical protein
MATGDTTDMAARLKRLLPPWFGESNPLVNALIAAAAAVLAFAYSLFAYARRRRAFAPQRASGSTSWRRTSSARASCAVPAKAMTAFAR